MASQTKVRSKSKTITKRNALKKKSKGQKSQSSSIRDKKRDVNTKFISAVEGIARSLHNTHDIPDDFSGYECNAGIVTDSKGRDWQIQCRAVVTKNKFLKANKIYPMIDGRRGVVVRVKAFIKYLIDKAFS
nr:hypothetical protein [uncultured Draconibacterium sp.]